MGIRDHPTAPRSPWQNGHAERLIGLIRGECLDHIVVFGEAHAKLLTADRRLRAVLVSLCPVVSKAPDFAILVRNFKCLILFGYSAQEIRTFRIPLVGGRGSEIETRR